MHNSLSHDKLEAIMDSTMWYLVALCGIFLLSLCAWALKFIFPNFRHRFVQHVKYPLLINRGYYWDSVTRLQGCFIILFFSLNLIMVFSPFSSFDWRKVERRAAFAAAINTIPLCLGGRTGPAVEAFNLHRSTYQVAHHWIGRIAVLEGLLHAAVVLSLRPRPGQLVSSGWFTFALTTAGFVFSLCLTRAWLGRWFMHSHCLIVLGIIGTMFWHVLHVSGPGAQAVVGTSGGLWIIFTLFRAYRIFGRQLSAKVISISPKDSNIIRIDIALRRPIRVLPGKYFNIFFPGRAFPYAIAHSYSAVAFWHLPDESNPSQPICHLSFLVSRRGSHAAALANLEVGQKILLEGPLGKDFRLKRVENVILVAQGIGIAGVLPLALELAERKRFDDNRKKELQSLYTRQEALQRQRLSDSNNASVEEEYSELQRQKALIDRQHPFRDATKKIDVFWSLESESQMEAVQDQLRALQKLDPENKLLVVWCGYQSLRQGREPFDTSRFWMCLDCSRQSFDSIIVSKIEKERKNSNGDVMVVACGTSTFSNRIREGVLNCMDGTAIDFAESEFRPKGGELAHVPLKQSSELAYLPAAYINRRNTHDA